MNIRLLTRSALTGAMALSLAACNVSSGDEGDDGASDPVPTVDLETTESSGLVTVQIPTIAQRTIFTESVRNAFTEFEAANALDPVNTSTFPSGAGTARYVGSSAMALLEESNGEAVAVLSGDVEMTADFSSPFNSINGTISNLQAQDIAEGQTVTVNSGAISLNDGTRGGGTFGGGVTGGFNVTVGEGAAAETVDFDVSGNFGGAFGTQTVEGDTMVGLIDGTATDGEGTETFQGVFSATQAP